MAQNIRALRTAGCDIIIDDVFYFVETPFQDGQLAPTNTNGGVVIQAVNDVTALGAMYFSSAGNSGNLKFSPPGAMSSKEYIYIGDRLLAVDSTNLP